MKPITLRQLHPSVWVLMLLFGCQKPSPEISPAANDQQVIASARAYFEQKVSGQAAVPTGNPRLDVAKSPYWEAAYCLPLTKGSAIVVPLIYQADLVVKNSFSGMQVLPLNQLTKLVFIPGRGGFTAQVITFFPDSNWRKPASDPYSGYVFVENWQGATITRYKYSGGLILTQSGSSTDTGSSDRMAASAPKQTEGILADCGTITGYNYSAVDPSELYSWSEPAGCDYSYIAGAEGPGVPPGQIPGLARPSIPLATIVVDPPSNIIGNISDYLKCFSNYGGTDHTYTVSVCVDQPVPGARTPWTVTSGGASGSTAAGNPFNVGHTFLVLSENFGSYSIVRNVGFYPQAIVTPWTPGAQGQLNDDEGHAYNISLTINVDNGQFFNVLNYVALGNNQGFMYNLNTDNCTTFGLNALAAAGIMLPSTKGSWVGGGFGNDPGDLGEDIQSMNLSSNMTRNTVSNPHPNQYNCN